MEVRIIRPEEEQQAERIVEVCMFAEPGRVPFPGEGPEMTTMAAFDDDGVMTSVVHSKPYIANYWGNFVGMSGVGEVSTLPEHRYKGHMKALLTLLLRDSRERGDLLSSLYPFSHPFYRKMGYENGPVLNIAEAELASYRAFPPIGTVRPYRPGEDDEMIADIYNDFIAPRNFGCLRSEKDWQGLLSGDPCATHRQPYLWLDAQGEAQGYFILYHARCKEKACYELPDYAFRTPEAFRGMLGFIGRLTHSEWPIRLLLPDEANPFLLFPEPYDVHVTRDCRGMVRVVNAEKCFALYPFAAPVTFTVRVDDPVLPENSGLYRVTNEEEPEDGEALNRVEKLQAEEAPDLQCSVQALSLLLTGAADLGELLANRTDVCVFSQLQPLLQAFHPGMSWLKEDF